MNTRSTLCRNMLFILSLFCIAAGGTSAAGELVNSDPGCAVWWTGSTYKVMKNDPVPSQKGNVVLWSAKNETESFQLILNPLQKLEDVAVSVTDFKKKDGTMISSANVTIRKVEYVRVTKPSGKLHKAGLYPDPLPVLPGSVTAVERINTPLFFTVKVPLSVAPGKYTAIVRMESSGWESSIPVELNVWDFALPGIPFMRSGFGLNTSHIKAYHNLGTNEELEQVTDDYFQAFKNYKISPYFFYGLHPIKKNVTGLHWEGGTFDPGNAFSGRYSYQIHDNSTGANTEGSNTSLIAIDPARPYLLKWQAKSLDETKKYTVTVRCYDADKKPIYRSLKWIAYNGSKTWREDTLYIDPQHFFAFEDLPDFRPFPENARYARISLYAALPDRDGSETGTVWFDDFRFIDLKTGENLLPAGDFEQEAGDLDLELDFREFDQAGKKYLDETGFTGFRVSLPELKPGLFYGKKTGWFAGFINGTPEYEKLITLYLKGFQDHLEAKGWLGKEYLYWVDEPKHEDYDFVREGMATIKRAAPKLKRFITENNPGPEIMDVTEIGCPVFYKVDPPKIKEWTAKGREFWSYLMCWPKEPHVNLFIDSEAINMRIWIWMSYRYQLKGILVWQSNQWNGNSASGPPGMLQNIWDDPMTYKSGYGTPYGSAPEFGNGDGMFFYPPNRDPNGDKSKYLTGPVPSLRLEILREGLDDYDYMIMLEDCIGKAGANQQNLVRKARQVLNFGTDVFVNDREYSRDPEVLMQLRKQMGNILEQFYSKK